MPAHTRRSDSEDRSSSERTSDKTSSSRTSKESDVAPTASEAVADVPVKTASEKTAADERAKPVADADHPEVNQSATEHPSGGLTVTQDGAAIGIKNYESEDEGPRSQLDLDEEAGRGR